MGKSIDLTGQTFGQLTVLEKVDPYISPRGQKLTRYSCKCTCGNIVTVTTLSLKQGRTRSCGCIRRQNAKKQGLANAKRNKYEFDGAVGKCYFSNADGYFLFDTEDYDLIKKYTWRHDRHVIKAHRHYENGKQQCVCLARLIMNCSEGMLINHINHDLLDNRKSNLRVCTVGQSRVRRKPRKDNKTGYVGVHAKQLPSGKCCYTVSISVNGKNTYLGSFKTAEEAYKVRLEAEKEYYGEFAQSSLEESEMTG